MRGAEEHAGNAQALQQVGHDPGQAGPVGLVLHSTQGAVSVNSTLLARAMSLKTSARGILKARWLHGLLVLPVLQRGGHGNDLSSSRASPVCSLGEGPFSVLAHHGHGCGWRRLPRSLGWWVRLLMVLMRDLLEKLRRCRRGRSAAGKKRRASPPSARPAGRGPPHCPLTCSSCRRPAGASRGRRPSWAGAHPSASGGWRAR